MRLGAILCPSNFRHEQALVGNEAQPGIAVELARKAIPQAEPQRYYGA